MNKKSYLIWMRRKLMKVRKCKYEMWKRYQETKSCSYYVEYKRVLKKTTLEYRVAQKIKIKLAQGIKSNPNFFYSYVRSKSQTKYKVAPLKDNSGNFVSADKDMLEVFNTFFSSVFTN